MRWLIDQPYPEFTAHVKWKTAFNRKETDPIPGGLSLEDILVNF